MMRVQNRFDSKKVGELVCDGALKYVQNFAVEIDGDRVAEYKSLDKLASDWKDYEPKEPLIKDKKIRKAVRAWAEASNIDEAMFEYINDCGSVFSDGSMGIKICFYSDLHLVSRSDYTIAELCGEEEE